MKNLLNLKLCQHLPNPSTHTHSLCISLWTLCFILLPSVILTWQLKAELRLFYTSYFRGRLRIRLVHLFVRELFFLIQEGNN